MRDPRLGRVGLVLLAGGGSRRLGTPKQLLRDGTGLSLVRRAALTALETSCRPVVAVLGAAADAVGAELAGLPLATAVNPEWESGLASSLKAGLAALMQDDPPAAALVMLCDQPGVTGALLEALVTAYRETDHEVVACEYGGGPGVPALFGRALFGALASLTGDEGARRVIRAYAGPVTRVPFPGGGLDVDTPEDAAALAASAGYTDGVGDCVYGF